MIGPLTPSEGHPTPVAWLVFSIVPLLLTLAGAVVARPWPVRIALLAEGIAILTNRKWHDGQLSSLQAALENIACDAAFMIYPVDHASIKRNTVEQLVRAFRTRAPSQEIVMPRHKGADGHPVIVSAAIRSEFFEARTAREVIYRVPERIRMLNVRTSSIFEDFDTPESYEDCVRKFRARK